MIRRFLTTSISLLLLPAALAAQETFVFTPQWTAQAQFAGYYVAQEKGFYQDEGVNVKIVHPSASQSAMQRMRGGESDATTLQLAQAIEIIENGIPLVNVLQTSMNNALVIASRRGKDPLSQHGARVGIWAAGFGQMAMCMSQIEHLDYQWVGFTNSINLFVSGAIDATLAMSYNEYYQLVSTGMRFDDSNVYRFCDHGYNVQEDGVYVKLDTWRKHRDAVERFARGSRRGWEYAAEHPEEALEIVMKYVEADKVATNRTLQKLMLDEVLRLQVDRESQQREFRLRRDHVSLASELMYRCGMLKREITFEELMPR